ncbi:MAG: hypothetical protein DRJ44_01020 [Thermoprotei archaeon]|nr:MAG: hypothetical protein DRJ44_01020 [Thermoprotei archaeon]
MKIFCTGISGSGRAEYLREFVKWSEKKHSQKIKMINIGDLMFETAKKLGQDIKEEKILDLSELTLKWLRAAVFEQVVGEVERKPGIYVVSTHASFRWRRYLLPAFDFFYLNKLSPDLFITVIDSIVDIKKRLENTRQWRGRLRFRDIITWQEEEVFITKILAEYQRKPFYVIPRQQPPSTLYDILFSQKKRVYLSYPMTHVEDYESYIKRVSKFKERLSEYFVVFDPGYIDDYRLLVEAYKALGEDKEYVDMNGFRISLSEVMEVEKDLRDQTVRRDFMLIDQSDFVVVYYTLPTLSPGVLSEIIYSFTNNKDVYLVFTPSNRVSPFFEYFSTRIFFKEEQFFDFLNSKEI